MWEPAAAILLFFVEGMAKILDFFFVSRSSMALIVLSMMPINYTELAKKAVVSIFSSAHSSSSSRSKSCILSELRDKSKLGRGAGLLFLKLLRFGCAFIAGRFTCSVFDVLVAAWKPGRASFSSFCRVAASHCSSAFYCGTGSAFKGILGESDA